MYCSPIHKDCLAGFSACSGGTEKRQNESLVGKRKDPEETCKLDLSGVS